jgi:diaminopimelate decarboxylase
MSRPWWAREGLEPRSGRLHFAGRDAEELAREHGTPLYVYDPARVEANARRLKGALEAAGVRHQMLFALKANRHPAVLSRLRSAGFLGIDACSPNEVSLALESGWKAEEISYTGTNLSPRDLDRILAHPVILNLDSLSAVRRVGARAPGRPIGLRLNPRVGTGYSAQLTYAGEKPTKFGIYEDQIEDAFAEARRHDLRIRGFHFHIGSGWLRDGIDAFHEACRRVAEIVWRANEPRRGAARIEYVNVGGGIGLPLQESDRAVDLDAYGSGIARHLGPLGVTVYCEPGDYVIKDAGILLVEVVTVEQKGGVTFVGVDCGFNAFVLSVMYRFAQEVILCRAADSPATLTCTLAGNINEAGDLFTESCRLPEVREGDILALLHAGGYGAAMASTHCSRPHALELAI